MIRQQIAGAGKRRERASEVMRNGAQQHGALPFPLHSHADFLPLRHKALALQRNTELRADCLNDEYLLCSRLRLQNKLALNAGGTHNGVLKRIGGQFRAQRNNAVDSDVFPYHVLPFFDDAFRAAGRKKARRDLIQGLCRAFVAAGKVHLRLQARGNSPRHNRRNKEKYQKHQIGCIVDLKRKTRLRKQEIKQHDRQERGPSRPAPAAGQHRAK
ncbi:hypothetical protein SDC9_85312 [bioreactor metagenome]|uniref:Uncharacterized protein n=1 Tax=bioreactor metagenome TaxID=1076179 RepID=A0A644ZCR3_9ZZZZ